MTEKNKHLDRITQDVFALWEAAWRAGYETCQEDMKDEKHNREVVKSLKNIDN